MSSVVSSRFFLRHIFRRILDNSLGLAVSWRNGTHLKCIFSSLYDDLHILRSLSCRGAALELCAAFESPRGQ